MKKYLEVKADSNDGDYATRRELITDEQLTAFEPLFRAIKNFKPYKVELEGWDGGWQHSHNFATGNCLREDLNELSPQELYVDSGIVSLDVFEKFEEEFLPTTDEGIHSIKSISSFTVNNLINYV